MATIGLLSLSAVISGCEDAAARERSEVQQTIAAISEELELALTGPAASSDDQTAQSLQGIVSRLGSVQGGEAGQQAAKSLLAATALRELGGIALATARQVEADLRAERLLALGKLNAALRLHGIAEGRLHATEASAHRESLQQDLQSARQHLNEFKSSMSELDQPIGDFVLLNSERSKQVEQLRRDMADLLRRAQELGHAAGFETYEQAVEKRREADRIEYEIAQTQLELNYSLSPDYDGAHAGASHAETMIQSIESALAELDAFVRAMGDDAGANLLAVNDLVAQITQAVESMNREMADTLNPRYDEVVGSFEQAAGQADNAIRQLSAEEKNSARLTAVRAYESLGQSHATKARGVADHRAMLELLAGARQQIPSVPDASGELKATTAGYQEAVEQAQSAYAQAQELLSQVQSRTDQATIDAFRHNLSAAMAALAGEKVGELMGTAPQQPEPPPDTSDEASPSEGFATAEALYEYLTNLPPTSEGMRSMMKLIHAETAEGRRAVKASLDMLDAASALDSAMQEQFGDSATEMFDQGMAMSMPNFTNATITEQTDDRVVYSFSVMGQTSHRVLRKINNQWWIDGDEMAEGDRNMLDHIEKLAASMKSVSDSLISRIRSGEFQTREEALTAMGEEMISLFGGMGGVENTPE